MNWLKRFMIGRYGTDQLSIALIFLSIALSILSRFLPSRIIDIIYIALLIIAYYRIFSKNTYKRYIENQKFIGFWIPIQNKFKRKINRITSRKEYKYFKCTNCKQRIRVPRGKGKIKVTCPKCRNIMIKKT